AVDTGHSSAKSHKNAFEVVPLFCVTKGLLNNDRGWALEHPLSLLDMALFRNSHHVCRSPFAQGANHPALKTPLTDQIRQRFERPMVRFFSRIESCFLVILHGLTSLLSIEWPPNSHRL